MKTTVFYHSADYDGIFCREVAKKFLGEENVEYVGWDFKNDPLIFPPEGKVYVLDLPVDRLFGMNFDGVVWLDIFNRLVWIDHHKSSIDSHPAVIGGYRIDGVAACRLAWQWFAGDWHKLEKHNILLQPNIQDFLERKVSEPWALTLAGEYDVWIHRGDGSFEFQFGLDAQTEAGFQELLSPNEDGVLAMNCYAKRDADIIRERSFLMEWEGLKFLTLNTPKCNSNTFKVRDIPETGHDAIMAFFWNGKKWIFSLYHAAHNRDIDLSLIAKKYGGGGHRGACGFQVNKLPFELSA